MDIEVDMGLAMSSLYGPCSDDSQCPGPEGICLTDGFPNGLCSRGCFIDPGNPSIRDGTNCQLTLPNGDTRFGACIDIDGTSACLPRCIASIDCGGAPFACVEITPAPGAPDTEEVCQVICAGDADCGGGVCNPYTARCVAPGGIPTTGGEIGDACAANEGCKSETCAGGFFGRAAPGNYCVGTCRIPPESEYAGSMPQAGCPVGAVCAPGTAGSAGLCLDECTPGVAGDCRDGYICANQIGGVNYSNGFCVGG
ncbi:MAG: hypothetical protein AAGH15_16640 [Myxococcota bacterium]